MSGLNGLESVVYEECHIKFHNQISSAIVLDIKTQDSMIHCMAIGGSISVFTAPH